MTDTLKPNAKLEDSQLWRAVSQIAKQAYGVLDEFPEEEKWGMQSRLRQQAFTATSEVAEAEGALDPRDHHWHLGLARKALFGIKNIFKLAHDVNVLKLNPKIMVEIDEAVKLIDQQTALSPTAIQDWYKLMNQPEKEKKR